MISATSPWLYLLPLVPVLPRSWLLWRFGQFMAEDLPDTERATAEHRTVILALAGFSFSAAIALAAYGASSSVNVLLPTYYVVVSFFCYLGALNTQAHKYLRWHDQVGSALADVATIALILAVLGMVATLNPPTAYLLILAVLALLVWSVDSYLRFSAWYSYFRGREIHD